MRNPIAPVLATCHTRPQNEALRTPSHVSRTLSIPEMESRISMNSPIPLQTQGNLPLCIGFLTSSST